MTNQISSENYEPKAIWYAIYKDGTKQSSKEISSDKIDRKNLTKFVLTTTDDRVIITQRLNKGQKLIYRSRTVLRQQGVLDKIHIVGWHQEHYRHVAFIFENDFTIEMGDFIDVDSKHADESPWLYSIKFADYDDIPVE